MYGNNSNSAVVSKQQTPPPRIQPRSPRTPRPEHTNISINITELVIIFIIFATNAVLKVKFVSNRPHALLLLVIIMSLFKPPLPFNH